MVTVRTVQFLYRDCPRCHCLLPQNRGIAGRAVTAMNPPGRLFIPRRRLLSMADRKFLASAIVAIVVLSTAITVAATVTTHYDDHSFTIIHTNDTHCFYDGDGGVGFTTVSALREDYSKDRTVFTVDAGDFIQGNSYGTMTDGEGSVAVMNTVGYDLAVPGNHEFDYGFDIFMERMSQLDFPVICANLVYKDSGENIFDEYLVLEKGGARVGFFGLLTTETEVETMAGNMGNSTVTDPIDAARRMVSVLEKKNVDCIVAVGHLGVSRVGYTTSDQLCNQVPGIDIFIDGHSHTEMEDGKVCDGSIVLEESGTVIASTGSYLHNVGVITYDSGKIEAKLYREPALQYQRTGDAIDAVTAEVDEKLKTVIGRTEIELVGERGLVRNGETNLGDFIADTIRGSTDADVAIINSGGIRTSIKEGDITLKDVYDVMPFLNYSCILNVPGSVLWEEMEFSLALMGATQGGFLQISGMTVTYDPDAAAGGRVTSITVGGTEVDKDATYKLATIDFIATGGDGNIYLKDYAATKYLALDMLFIGYVTNIGTVTEDMIEMGRLVAV